MKKRFYITTALSITSVALLFSSCLKDSKYSVDFTKTTPLVELPGAAGVGSQGGYFESVAITSSPTAPSPFNVPVNLAAPKPLGTDLKVTLTANQAALDAYNTANGTTYTILPAADYNSNALTATIPAGKNLVNLVINVNTSALQQGVQYVLPLTITNASGIQISNYNTILYYITVKNPYDGQYTVHGFAFRDIGGGANDPALGGNFTTTGVPLLTVSDNAVSFAPLWASGQGAGGVGGTTLTVDPSTNKVTVASSANATLANDPAYNSHYDPSAKTFYISFKWGVSPSDRAETDTLVYTGSN